MNRNLKWRNNEIFSSDAHGNTDEAYGTTTKRYIYDAYGNQINENADDDNPYRYCGENYDEETGLYYLRARYYDPSIGRFLSEAPAQDGLNWYVYCGNNPVVFVDPSGMVMDGDELYGDLKYAMLCYLGDAYNRADTEDKKATIHQVANALRNFNADTFNRLIYMNDSDGALEQGHAGLLLLNNENKGLLFSFYPTKETFPYVFDVDAEMRFDVLSADDVNNLLYGSGQIQDAVASDGDIMRGEHIENYDRFVYYDIDSGQGYNMFNEGAWLFHNPGTYTLAGRQCDNIVNRIMTTAGLGYTVQWRPNATYEKLSEEHSNWSL